MATRRYVYSRALTVTSCGECAIPFAIPDDLYRQRLTDGESFYCPNGHCISWSETENARLQRELKQERDRRAATAADLDQTRASLRTTKGVVTKLRNRAAAGECPFCGEHVYQLARHVDRKHPDEASRPDDDGPGR